MNTRLLPMILVVSLVSCRNEPSTFSSIVPQPLPPVKAVYVLNEGNFGDPTGARLTVYDTDRDSLYHDVYETGNGGSHLGSVGDDMQFYNGRAYFVMSGSQNIVVMNLAAKRKEREAFFPGSAVHDLLIDSTRNKLFVTRLFSSSVFVLNLTSLAIIDTIGVGSNPQGMALVGNKLFVCNSGYGNDSTVTIIDASTNRVTGTLTLAKGPSSAAVASDGKLWVACTGNAFATPPVNGKLFVIDPALGAKVDSLAFNEDLYGSITIGADGYAYVIGSSAGFGGAVHRVFTANKAVTLNFISGEYYGLAFDDERREIYLTNVRNFANDGEVKIYTTSGALRKSFAAQKGPSVVGFVR